MTATISSIVDRLGRGTASDTEIPSPPSDSVPTALTQSGPVAVFSSYVVSPAEADVWIASWARLAHAAATWPGCRSFRLARDRYDEMYVAVLSEWDSMEAYVDFTRETQAMVPQRGRSHVFVPAESRFLDVVSAESPLSAGR